MRSKRNKIALILLAASVAFPAAAQNRQDEGRHGHQQYREQQQRQSQQRQPHYQRQPGLREAPVRAMPQSRPDRSNWQAQRQAEPQRRDWNDRSNRGPDRRDWNNGRNDRGQDRRGWDGRDNNRPVYGSRPDNRNWDRGRNDGRRWDNGWRNDRRYDWRSYRSAHRDHYRLPRYSAPRGYRYRVWSPGYRLEPFFYGSNYWISDPWAYRLPPAYGPYRWVRYYDDVLLVDVTNGMIVDVIRDFFW